MSRDLFDCRIAPGNPHVHFPLGCVERTGHASPAAAVLGLPGVLHLCKVSPSVITDMMCDNLPLNIPDGGTGNWGLYILNAQKM